MRLPLATLEVFAAIAQHGSLRAAADALGIKPSTVSHQLKSLEDQLGTVLFARTTRSINLTESGRALMRGTLPAFQQLSEAVQAARNTGQAARGTLKLAVPEFAYYLFIGAAITSFRQAYPDIELELSVADAFSDLLAEELHAGIRLGDNIAEDMIAVRLTPPLELVIGASPDYAKRFGLPGEPRDLLDHECIRYRFQSSGRIAPWQFEGEEGSYAVEIRGSLTVNTLPASVDLARRGLGLVYTFREFCARDLENGDLVPALAEFLPVTPGLHLYFPREYRNMVPLRLFLEHLKSEARHQTRT
ncbi:MAG: LysR family transcriptional regulator [Roseibium sp.]|uniref:LysR family transcriptional regulator n=1 Tax=Roseibium sp. TaxID=1936156 RepID=UPI001B2BFD60|nr:LysR family transcriptional regulator [Roseibium sp.]MBO6892029.1 LysR family transcriptional regulator [Roseibium sp.]MBO6929312.1 LysR family transcriptional regulator [Roseibium sp.]